MSSNTIQLKQATSTHHSLLRELFTEYLEFLCDMELKLFGAGFDVESVVNSDMKELAELAPPEGRLLLVYSNEDVVGMGGFRTIRPGVAELKRFYIRPKSRRQGLARKLLSTLIDDARQLNFHSLYLDAAPYSEAARELYHSAGFTLCEQYPESEAPKNYLNVWSFMKFDLSSN